MTARDDARTAIVDAFRDQHQNANVYDAIRETLDAAGYLPLFEFIIDAVPPRVLAQLAIDTGALEPSTLDQTGTLYRLTEGETTGNDLSMVWGLRWQQQFDRAERAEARIAELEGGPGGS